MRVVSGENKGRKLLEIEGDEVRPTTDRVKESIFNIIQFSVVGGLFLDLFAGSGQMGIEALSRGASKAVFVDKSKKSCDICKENIKMLNYEEKSSITNCSAEIYLNGTGERFDVAFLDPPYKLGILEPCLLSVSDKMTDNGVIVCEHPIGVNLSKQVGDFILNKTYKYGQILVSVYKRQ